MATTELSNETASPLAEVLIAYKAPLTVIIFVVAIVVLTKVLKLDLLVFVEKIWEEIRDLLSRKWTTGSINVLGIVVVFIFGLVLMGAHAFEYVAEWLTIIGKDHASEIAKKSGDGLALAVTIAAVALGSVIVVAKVGAGK